MGGQVAPSSTSYILLHSKLPQASRPEASCLIHTQVGSSPLLTETQDQRSVLVSELFEFASQWSENSWGLNGGGGSCFRKSRSIESWNLYLGIDINIDVEIKIQILEIYFSLASLPWGVVSSCIRELRPETAE